MNTTIKKSKLTAVINPKGAELISLIDAENREYIWEGNPKFWAKHSPVLFPIVGTLKNDTYHYNNVDYYLGRHGFARDLNFELVAQSESSALFSLSASEETRKVFPFDFNLQILYTLTENKLTITYKVANKNEVPLPFSLGAHPAFSLPEPFENYALAFEFSENLISYQLENDLLSDKKTCLNRKENQISLAYSLFEKDALIFKKLESKQLTLLENGNPLLRLRFMDFSNLGIWTKTDAPFICLEPWLGYSDTVTATGNILEKEGIQLLEPQKTFECHFDIEIL